MRTLWTAYENGSKIYEVLGGGGFTVECMVNGVRCDACGLTREEAKKYAANPEEGLPQTYWDRALNRGELPCRDIWEESQDGAQTIRLSQGIRCF